MALINENANASVAVEKIKKRRVHQVAKEFNISIESLLEFLQKHEFKVTSPMSPVTEEMYELIVQKFKKERPVSEFDEELRRRLEERRAREEEKKRQIEQEIRRLTEMSTSISLLAEEGEETKAEAKEEVPREEVEPIVEEKVEKTPEERKLEAVLALVDQEVDLETPPPQEVEEEVEVEEAPEEVPPVEEVEEAPTEVEAEEVKVEEEEKEEVKEEAEATLVIEESEVPVRIRTIRSEPKKPKKEEKPREKKEKKKKRKKEHFVVQEEVVTPKKGKRKKKERRPRISEEEIEEAIRRTMAVMEDRGRPRRRRPKVKEKAPAVEEAENLIRVSEFITVGELAHHMDVEPSEVIKKCMELGVMVTINQRLDWDTIVTVADEFGFEVERLEEYGVDKIEELEREEEDEKYAVPRPPVVTIMGHVDHGKTTLLDYIRKSNIVAGEVGGITQHIGAYVVTVDSHQITFLDTPGHEAFTAMRARGAQVTDIVVLVVAADDRVMPQTVEAIDHAKAAGVPIIVAINKMDKPNANPEAIKKQLADRGVLVEEWGGKYPCVEISAKTGQNVDQLLGLILLQAELMELKANPNRLARGVVIESRLDKGKGPVATVLIQKGTLRIGDPVIAGQCYGKVRAMFDERNRPVEEAPPSIPVQVVGFSELPQAGDVVVALKSERDAREISLRRQQLKREQELRRIRHLSLDEISRRIGQKEIKELRIILKADVDGSLEALSDSLHKLPTDEVTINVIHKGVGAISETDVLLASASDAVVIGFQVRPNPKAWELAKREKVEIRTYSVIYELVNDVKAALEGMLEPEQKEELLGTAEVRQTFRIPKVGTVAGCYVVSGKITRNARARLVRDGRVVYEGKIGSLKRFKDDVREVASGFECGVGLENFNDIKVGDVIEAFQIIQVKAVLNSGS